MTALQSWIHTPLAKTLGLALAHFVWEGAAIAALLGIALWIARGASARVRYALGCAALAALPIAFAITLAMLAPHPGVHAVIALPVLDSAPVDFPIPAGAPEPWRFADHVAWAAPLWIAGVLCLFLYRLGSWITADRLRRRGTWAVSPDWSRRFDALAERVGVSRAVKLLESALAEVPMVIGYLRPVVLIPMGMLAGLPVDQVEAILLHELAHIRRADYLVNLAQSAIESLLFYHPAVWWISSVVRVERENCCDDFVIARQTDPGTYAAALLALEQGRAGEPALAATGGDLLRRVQRLLRKPASHDRSVAILPVSLAIAGIAVAGVALAAWQPAGPRGVARPGTKIADRGVAASTILPTSPAPHPTLLAQARQTTTQGGRGPRGGAPDAPAAEPSTTTPYTKWINEDAAYIITNQERAEWNKLTTDDQREQFISNFWERRNPIPGSATNPYKDEHYRRIAIANTRFKSGIPGWKTDRGRIYITYGPPDEIESHPSGGAYTRPPEQGGGTTNTYPFEKWRYRFIEGLGQNVILEFVDQDRNGEYHLSTDPNAKDVASALRLLDDGASLIAERNRQNGSNTIQQPQVVQGVPSGPSARGFGDKHAGALIYLGGQVTLVIPLEGPGVNHIYGRIKTAEGNVITYWEEDANPANLNFVHKIVLQPGSYVFSAARSARDNETEVVNFTVK